MMFAYSIVGILVLLLIYFVVRGQGVQRELAVTRNGMRVNAKKAHLAATNLLLVSNELQRVYLGRVETAQRKGVISTGNYTVLSILMRNFSRIIMDCSEKGATVEEALTHALNTEDISLDDVKEYIKTCPSEVRMPWVKNTPSGFVSACNSLTQNLMGTEKPANKEGDAGETATA